MSHQFEYNKNWSCHDYMLRIITIKYMHHPSVLSVTIFYFFTFNFFSILFMISYLFLLNMLRHKFDCLTI